MMGIEANFVSGIALRWSAGSARAAARRGRSIEPFRFPYDDFRHSP
jgi:hypothetical protein